MIRVWRVALKITQKLWLVLFILASLGFVANYFYHNALKLDRKFQLSVDALFFTVSAQLLFWFTASSIWRQIVRLVSTTKLSLLQSYSQLALVGIGKYLPGKVWGMVARGLQLKKLGVDAQKIVVATFYEQYALLHAAVVLCAALAVPIVPKRLIWPVVIIAGGALVAGVSLRHIGIRGLLFVWRRLRKEDLAVNYPAIDARNYMILMSKFVFLWVLNGLVYSGLYFSFFQSRYDSHLLPIMVLANTVGITAGFLALFAPGGVGVREVVSSAILAQVLPLKDAAMLSLIYRLWVVAMEMLSGIAILPVTNVSVTKKAA